jgi:hypothetical protein
MGLNIFKLLTQVFLQNKLGEIVRLTNSHRRLSLLAQVLTETKEIIADSGC